MTHKKKIGTVAYYVVGILIAILAIIPFLWMVSTSLKARGALMSIPIEWIPKEPTIASYVKVFSKFPFFSTIGNSLFISVTYTFITLISASMAAFAFAKLKFPKADLLLKLFLATMMIPTQVTIIPLFVVMNKMSLINSYASVILPSIFRPLCAATLATLSITTFMESWNDYLWPLLMLTDKTKMTLPIALSTLNGQFATEYNVLMAGSLISMIPVILIYCFAQKYFQNGMMAGGIKG